MKIHSISNDLLNYQRKNLGVFNLTQYMLNEIGSSMMMIDKPEKKKIYGIKKDFNDLLGFSSSGSSVIINVESGTELHILNFIDVVKLLEKLNEETCTPISRLYVYLNPNTFPDIEETKESLIKIFKEIAAFSDCFIMFSNDIDEIIFDYDDHMFTYKEVLCQNLN